MGTRKLLIGVAVAALLAVSALAVAQRGGGMGRGGGRFGPGGGLRGFDPEQMRQELLAAGATEADLSAIERYRTTQRGLVEPLMRAIEGLREAAGESATNEQAEQAVTEYEKLKASAMADLAKAEENLKAELKLSAKPKLHAMLLSIGVLDNGIRLGLLGRRGGPGGRGGDRGGRGGGPGGFPSEGRGSASFDGRTLPNTDAERTILAVLADMEENQRWGMANVSRDDGRLLRLLAEAIRAKHVVEIGTSNGYSSIWLCLALQATSGKLTTHEIDAERVALARENFDRAGVGHIATVVEGDAHETVTRMEEPIDLLFLDADKEGYLDYLTKLLPRVRPGGLVVAHNMHSPPPDPRYVRAITTNPALETVFLDMQAAGVGVTLKKL